MFCLLCGLRETATNVPDIACVFTLRILSATIKIRSEHEPSTGNVAVCVCVVCVSETDRRRKRERASKRQECEVERKGESKVGTNDITSSAPQYN